MRLVLAVITQTVPQHWRGTLMALHTVRVPLSCLAPFTPCVVYIHACTYTYTHT